MIDWYIRLIDYHEGKTILEIFILMSFHFMQCNVKIWKIKQKPAEMQKQNWKKRVLHISLVTLL